MTGQPSQIFPWVPATGTDGHGVVIELMYRRARGRLRLLARNLLARERRGHTLQATALIHEAFVRFLRWPCRVESEAHFFHLTARAMKEALIDHARVRGGRIYLTPDALPEALLTVKRPDINPELALTLQIVWERLRERDTTAANVIWMLYVEERTLDETCRALKRTLSRVRGDAEFGLTWMASQLGKDT